MLSPGFEVLKNSYRIKCNLQFLGCEYFLSTHNDLEFLGPSTHTSSSTAQVSTVIKFQDSQSWDAQKSGWGPGICNLKQIFLWTLIVWVDRKETSLSASIAL